MGYSRAGFDEIVGVDIKPQPHYPFAFVQADALEYVAEHGHEFDAIHASPPCQGYSSMRNLPWLREKEYPLLIDPVRALLEATGKPWVIENVMGAKLPAGWLCGTMFDLPFYRHRYFETPFFWLAPGHAQHFHLGSRARTITWQSELTRANTIAHAPVAVYRAAAVAMDIDWMTQEELSQAIPPAYTEYVGQGLLHALS